MTRIPTVLLCLMVVGFGSVLVGCSAGAITDDQQQAKVKALNDIAKKDPHYQEKRSRGGGHD